MSQAKTVHVTRGDPDIPRPRQIRENPLPLAGEGRVRGAASPRSPRERPWRPAPLRLEYQLGELPLLRIPLRGLVLSSGALTGDHGHGDRSPPGALHSGEVDAALVSSLPIADKLPRLSLHQRCLRYVPAQYRRHFIDLQAGTFEDYLRGFSTKTRSTLRRKLRKLTEAGVMECRQYRTPGQFDDFLALARPLSERTYQERLLGKGLPVTEEFEREMRDLAAIGQLRAYLLTLDGRPAAFILCPISDGVVQYEWVGYEPDLAALSPGTVLQYLVLEQLFAEGIHRLFDFTEGEGAHKQLWSRASALCADVYYLRPNLQNFVMVGSHAAVAVTSRTAVTVLERLGVKERVKSILRQLF